MQSKGWIRLVAILLAIASIWQLSFTAVTRIQENKAAKYAEEQALQFVESNNVAAEVREYVQDSVANIRNRAYIDSISSEKAFFGYTYQSVKEKEINLGLDLKGGMNVMLQVQLEDLVKALSGNSQDPDFAAALAQAKQNNVNSSQDFIGLFADAWNQVAPQRRLAEIFATYELRDKVSNDATNAEVDYSTYEVIVLGSKPNSGAAGFRVLKGYDKPMVLLKPFLLKSGVWDWGTAANTQDLGISVSHPEHALFSGLTITDGTLPLFSACNTNAVTAISAWNNTTGYELLGAPLSQSGYTTVADFPAGTNCNGTILPQRLIMIGVSEYSTANLTTEGLKLIENAICLLLGIPNPHPQGIENHPSAIINKKFIHNGQLFIQTGDAVYSIDGRRVIR